MGFVPTVRPARLNGVYLSRHSRCQGGTVSPLAPRTVAAPTGRKDDISVVASAGNYGHADGAMRSVPRQWPASMPLNDALTVNSPQSRSQLQPFDALTDSCLNRHRDWRSNRDGAGTPGLLRHLHKHDERVTTWIRESSSVNDEVAEIQEGKPISSSSQPAPLSRRALSSLLPCPPHILPTPRQRFTQAPPPPRSIASRARAHRKELEALERAPIKSISDSRRPSMLTPGTVSKCERLGCTRSGWTTIQPPGHVSKQSTPEHTRLWGVGMAGRSGRASTTNFPLEYTQRITGILQDPAGYDLQRTRSLNSAPHLNSANESHYLRR